MAFYLLAIFITIENCSSRRILHANKNTTRYTCTISYVSRKNNNNRLHKRYVMRMLTRHVIFKSTADCYARMGDLKLRNT